MVTITSTDLNIAAIIDAATDLSAGGTNVFIGTIRDYNVPKQKKVIRLEYEAYEPMAVAEIQRIAKVATAKWEIRRWAVSHRVGILKPGEAAVVIVVSTTHRKESFEACQFLIDEIKASVPIWKKEVLEDGEEWVSAHP